MVRNSQGRKTALERELTGHSKGIRRLGVHSEVDRNRVALVGDMLLGGRVHRVSRDLRHVGSGRHASASRQRQRAELIHDDSAHAIRVLADVLRGDLTDMLSGELTDVLTMGSRDIVLGDAAELSAHIGRVAAAAIVSSLFRHGRIGTIVTHGDCCRLKSTCQYRSVNVATGVRGSGEGKESD